MHWLAISGAVSPFLLAGVTVAGGIWLKRISTEPDRAAAIKARAEARVAEALADKTRAETVSIEVATARAIIAEVQVLMDRQRTDYETRLTTQDGRITSLLERMAAMETREKALLAAIASHAVWDGDALDILRSMQTDYPPPPPIHPDYRPPAGS